MLQSHPQTVPRQTQATHLLNGDQPYYQALAGSATICSIHSASANDLSILRDKRCHSSRAGRDIQIWTLECFSGGARINPTVTGSSAFRRWDARPAGSRTFRSPKQPHDTKDSSSNHRLHAYIDRGPWWHHICASREIFQLQMPK